MKLARFIAGLFWRYWYGLSPWRAQLEIRMYSDGDWRAQYGYAAWSARELKRLALIAGL